MSYVIVQLLSVFLNRRKEVFWFVAMCLGPCMLRRRGLRRCYRDRGTAVAAARAASGFTAGYQTDHLVRGRGLRRCYRGCGTSVAAARAASGFTAGVSDRSPCPPTRLAPLLQGCGTSVAAARAASGAPRSVRQSPWGDQTLPASASWWAWRRRSRLLVRCRRMAARAASES